MHTRHRPLRLITLAALLAPLAPAIAADINLQQRVEQLERELMELKGMLAEEKQQQQTRGVEIKKGTRFQYGGYIKMDALASKYSGGERATSTVGDDLLVASTIPIGGNGGDTNLDMHAKTSRLWFKTRTDSGHGEVRTHLEMDFAINQLGDERISNSSVNRMRHAYVAWDYDEDVTLLGGQTWTTFFNVGSLPEILDFVGPVGTLFDRQAQLRWSRKLANGGTLMLAAENPSTSLYGSDGATLGASTGGSTAFDNNAMPDLIARYDGSVGQLGYSAAAMLRQIAYKQTFTNSLAATVNGDEDKTGYAVSVAGKWKLGDDDLRFQMNYGNALGRYMGLQTYRDGVIEDDGGIDLITQVGGFVAYRHMWDAKTRSNLVLSASSADNPSIVPADTPSSYQSAHANLLYSPTDNLTLGGEYIYARKTIEGTVNGDDSGTLNRLQFSMKYAF